MNTFSTMLFFFIVIFTSVLAYGQENKTELQAQNGATYSVEVSFDYDTGIPTKLTFDVQSKRKKVWLGVSLYPKTVSDALREGEHQQIEVNGETFGKVVKVGKKFGGGTFETALWGKKVMRAECKIEDCYWCEKNGFHLDELLGYKSGSFNYSH